MHSKYFHINFFAEDLIDNDARWSYDTMTYSNVGFVINSIYLDEIINSFGGLIVTEKLFWLLKYESGLTGFFFEKPLRYKKGLDFLANYSDTVIPPFRYMKLTGVPLKDDFSFYQRVHGAYNWVLSEKAIVFLLENGMIHAHGEEIIGSIKEYCDNYAERVKAANYYQVMPRLFLKDFIKEY